MEEIPFTKAAEIGTRKVITDHSTIGIVVTCDGSFGDIPRENYLAAEERTIRELKKLKNGWTSKRDKYEEAHRAELTLWNAASRYLHANLPKGTKTLPISEWEKEYATLSGQRTAEYTKLKETRAEVAELHNIRKCVDIALKADQPEQTRAKRHDLER